jgi:hypothetical protein
MARHKIQSTPRTTVMSLLNRNPPSFCCRTTTICRKRFLTAPSWPFVTGQLCRRTHLSGGLKNREPLRNVYPKCLRLWVLDKASRCDRVEIHLAYGIFGAALY